MPSDDRAGEALTLLAEPLARYRTSLATTIDQVRASLSAAGGSDANAHADRRVEHIRGELGSFATGRIDERRFAALFAGNGALDATTQRRMSDAFEVLVHVMGRLDELAIVDVPSGGSLRDAVAGALASIGRGFGAALAVQFARTGRYRPEEHGGMLQSFPFARWNKAERRLAPPLVVSVDGADLQAGSLSDFVDGAMKIVLLPRGACPPASLVRLITPETFVMQTTEIADLTRASKAEGPAVVAVVPEGAARFVHDPAAGREAWQRLTVQAMPSAPTRAIGAVSAWQQAEELRQLAVLAARPSIPDLPLASLVPAGVGADPADRLATWLLDHAEA